MIGHDCSRSVGVSAVLFTLCNVATVQPLDLHEAETCFSSRRSLLQQDMSETGEGCAGL